MTIAKKSHHDDNLNITIEFLETGISLYEDFTVVPCQDVPHEKDMCEICILEIA